MGTARARALRKAPTDAERKLWQSLRLRQTEGHKFRRQQVIGPYIADFVCYEKKLIVELDGGQHLGHRLYDEQRTRWLEARGFIVLRFWDNEVLNQTEAVAEAIRVALGDNGPPELGSAKKI